MNNRIVVLGAGISGVGAAVLAKKRGFDVFVSDNANITDENKEVLLNNEIDFFTNESFYKSLEETLSVLNRLNCNIYIMVQVPEFSDVPSLHLRSSWPYHFNLRTFKWVGSYPEISELELHNKFLKQINLLNKVSIKFENVRILDPLPLMLTINEKYKMFEKGEPIYCDHNHLSVKGSRKIKSLFNFSKNLPKL